MTERLSFDLVTNDLASAGFAAAGRSAAAASDDVLALGKRLDEIGKKSATARVGLAGDKDADLSLDKLNLKLLKLGRTVTNPKISLDGALKAAVEIKGLELELDKLNRKAASISASGGGLSALEKLLGSVAGGGAQAGGGAISGILSTPGLGPAALAAMAAAVAALLTELDGLASGFAAAGAGVGAFALLALPTFKSIATAYTGISAAHAKYMAALATEKESPTKANAAAAAKALVALQVAQENLSPSTKKAVGGIQSLDDEYHKMATAFAPDALKVFDDALGIANTLLPDIKPFADTAAGAIDGLLKKAGVFFKSADFKKWLGDFEKIAGPALTAIGQGIGQLTISTGKLFTTMSAKDVVHAINIAFDIINGALTATRYVIERLMTDWDQMVVLFKDGTANAKLHISQLVSYFGSTVHAFELVRDETAVVWGHMEEDVLHLALSITGTMGKLPGPLGAPFRSAHAAIQHELTGIEADVAGAAARITSDWAKLHGVAANITVRADGTFKVGTTGPVARAAGGLITGGTPGRDSVLAALMPGEVVVPTRMVSAGAVDHLRGQLPGFASGGVVGSYSGAVPGVAPWMSKEATATQAMLETLTAKAAAAAMKTLAAAGGAAGPGGGAPSANAALAQRLYAGQLTPSVWAAWNAVAMRESGWNQFARNASSGAYGIPQALPESKLPPAGRASGGSNPTAQINWMWNYMAGRYGGPIGAEQHEQAFGWYGKGTGGAAPGWGVVGEQGTELVRFHGGETVLPHSMTSRIMSGLLPGMPGYAAGTAKPSAQQAKWLAELAADVASRNKLATARSKSDHARQLAVTAEELLVLQHPGNKPDAAKLASMRKSLGSWEASTLKPISLLNREITLLRTLTGNPVAVKYGGPGPAPVTPPDTSGTDPGSTDPGTAAAAPAGPAPGTPVLAVTGGSVAPVLPGSPWTGGALALPPRTPAWYGGGGPYAGGVPQGGYGSRSGFEQGIPAALIAEMKAMHASMVMMHKGIVAAVGKVAPGVSRGLDGMARGVVTR